MLKVESSTAMRPPLLFGWHIDDPNNGNLLGLVTLIASLGISFLVLDLNKLSGRPDSSQLFDQWNHLESEIFSSGDSIKMLKNFSPLGRSDLALDNGVWAQRIVSLIRTNDIETLKTQLDWSVYVSARSIVIDLESVLKPKPEKATHSGQQRSDDAELLDRLATLCQVLSSYLCVPNLPTIWISLDCVNQAWNTWYMIYEMCNFSEKLKVCLKLQPVETDVEVWQSEPVKCLIIPENSMVVANNKVSLDKTVSKHLEVLLRNNVKVVFSSNLNYKSLMDNTATNEPNETEDLVMEDCADGPNVKSLLRIVRRIYNRLGPLTVRELYGTGYEDVLQMPMQPLRDNLDSTAYNEFEKCSFKYDSYYRAMDSFIANNKSELAGLHFMVYVLGAGRGPLVEVAVHVFRKNYIGNYTIFALDKNPYTMLTLQDKMSTKAWQNVKLLCVDMRGLNKTMFQVNSGGAKEVHLALSELLGPFGDNELAPECLYGFEKSYKVSDTLHFIPESYTSYVMPLHAPQLWAKIRNLGNVKSFHTPYTVNLKSYYNVGTQYMGCFHFEHPSQRAGMTEDNLERYRVMRFLARNDSYVHGFGAYFKCSLYGGVELSILPQEAENVKSWFPMFFPIEMPFAVKRSQIITLHVWRKTDDVRVWYEWAFSTPATTAIHNVNGISYSISKV